MKYVSFTLLLCLLSCAKPESETTDSETADGTSGAAFRTLTLADFEPVQGEDGTWTEADGVIRCSGKPKGYMHTREVFDNFTLRCEYRFEPVKDEEQRNLANTGFMIHIQEPHKVWPNSLEVQGRFDEMCSIKANGGAATLSIDDHPEAREEARKPVGEWNQVEIVSDSGALTATLNGKLICTSQPGELTSGFLGLQSEGYVVEFRGLEVMVAPGE